MNQLKENFFINEVKIVFFLRQKSTQKPFKTKSGRKIIFSFRCRVEGDRPRGKRSKKPSSSFTFHDKIVERTTKPGKQKLFSLSVDESKRGISKYLRKASGVKATPRAFHIFPLKYFRLARNQQKLSRKFSFAVYNVNITT